MNTDIKAIYKKHLEHSAKGQTWGKHKYIAIKNGRYIYPEDLQKNAASKVNSKTAIGNRQLRSKTPEEQAAYKDYVNRRSAHQGYTQYKNNQAKEAYIKQQRSRQINDQIRSSHANATSSKMELTPGSELKKRAEERKAKLNLASNKTKEQEIAEQIKRNNSGTISEKKEEPKKEEPATTTTTSTTETTTEEKKSGSGKGKGKGSGKKSSGSKKSSKKENTTKTEQTTTPASASEEAKALGLSEDDIKLLDSNIDINATDRDTVIRNLALRVIKGDFGNGADRRTKLGKYYTEIQKKVNELMKELKSSKSTQMKQSASYGFDVLKEVGGAMGILIHDGVKKRSGRYPYGSGDRPFQHDGRRSARDMSDDDLKKAVARKGLERQYNKMYGNNKLEKTKNLVDATSGAVNRASNKSHEKINRRPKRERMNLDGMTDKELRDKINRELLEKQYSDLFGPEVETVTKGERVASEVLDYASDVLAIGSSALAIALALKGLKTPTL